VKCQEIEKRAIYNEDMFLIVAGASALAAFLTFFSGFGLGTLLMPVFALFLPVTTAIAATAVVHLLNSIFKFILVFSKTKWTLVWGFGLPALLAALGGALILKWAAADTALLNRMVGVFLILFVWAEGSKQFSKISFDSSNKFLLALGGVLSGFMGGLTGQQGALRALFLVKSGLSKEAYIATNAAITLMVDLARLFIYTQWMKFSVFYHPLVLSGVIFAFLGSFIGSRFIEKVTWDWMHRVVAVFLTLIGIYLILGFTH